MQIIPDAIPFPHGHKLTQPQIVLAGVPHEIDVATKTVKVTVSMFGRETPVELQFGQVAALEQ